MQFLWIKSEKNMGNQVYTIRKTYKKQITLFLIGGFSRFRHFDSHLELCTFKLLIQGRRHLGSFCWIDSHFVQRPFRTKPTSYKGDHFVQKHRSHFEQGFFVQGGTWIFTRRGMISFKDHFLQKPKIQFCFWDWVHPSPWLTFNNTSKGQISCIYRIVKASHY